jgi:hypothetical protein
MSIEDHSVQCKPLSVGSKGLRIALGVAAVGAAAAGVFAIGALVMGALVMRRFVVHQSRIGSIGLPELIDNE